jgi:AraC-like DNA-binding protein
MFVHGSRIQKQFEYLEKSGIEILPLYSQTGISRDTVFDQDTIFDFEQYKVVLDFALRQTNNPEYGLDFGNQRQLGGTVGMLSASAKNLKEALLMGSKFLKTQGDFAELQFVDDDRFPKLVYTPVMAWVLESPQTAKLEVDAMFAFLNTILDINSNGTLKPLKLKLAFSKPQYPEKYREVFGIMPEFECEHNEMIFENAALLIPMKAYNPETFLVLSQHLESRLIQLSNSEKVTDKVKKVLYTSFKYQFPDIDSVAEKLNFSSRTLQRKLSEEDTSFKEVLQETRFGIAQQLLSQDHLTVSEISYILGYSDLANFSRSFKKYSGKSPLEYKENSLKENEKSPPI